MRFNLALHTDRPYAVLPINYQYPLAAAIYKIIDCADEKYADFLHNHGYHLENSLKGFKLFTFSDIRTPFHIHDDRLILDGTNAEVQIAFHLPEAAENFIRGLFINRQLDIADHISRTSFHVQQVESVALWPDGSKTVIFPASIHLQPLSPLVVGRKNERGHYDFLSPETSGFTTWLLHNWKEKYHIVYPDEDTEEVFSSIKMEVITGHYSPRSRLITIKAHTKEETKIRGYTHFNLRVTIHSVEGIKAIELAMNAGLGQYNSMGMGCINIKPYGFANP
jgi:CRISPR-associated endoribonuclease Cas6